MINLLDEIEKVRSEGYNEANAEARICQILFFAELQIVP